mmetsp:Transcript_5407/g.10898  ORF Transcript_5407/g.10898 Transcript_5407/m.10898 type:complete len:292 (-) Transcript_5407:722-1597(-)
MGKSERSPYTEVPRALLVRLDWNSNPMGLSHVRTHPRTTCSCSSAGPSAPRHTRPQNMCSCWLVGTRDVKNPTNKYITSTSSPDSPSPPPSRGIAGPRACWKGKPSSSSFSARSPCSSSSSSSLWNCTRPISRCCCCGCCCGGCCPNGNWSLKYPVWCRKMAMAHTTSAYMRSFGASCPSAHTKKASFSASSIEFCLRSPKSSSCPTSCSALSLLLLLRCALAPGRRSTPRASASGTASAAASGRRAGSASFSNTVGRLVGAACRSAMGATGQSGVAAWSAGGLKCARYAA